MTPTERDHKELFEDVCKSAEEIIYELDPGKTHLIHMAMGVAGEAGELLDAIKKHTMYNKPLVLSNVVEELGDLEFYIHGIREFLGLTRDSVLINNIHKLRARYPDGYSNAAAAARADKLAEDSIVADKHPDTLT